MSELHEQMDNRRRKLEELARQGVELYPHRFEHDMSPSDVHASWGDRSGPDIEAEDLTLRVPGRLRGIRGHGKVMFLDLDDGRGKLQLFVRRPQLTEAAQALLDQLDLGDLVGATGKLIRTRAGELSLDLTDLVLLAKALRPLPEKWHGLTDVEARYRQRYLDLATNPDSRRVFELRSLLVREVRAFLDERGFLEVETPMMQLVAGGAAARPFVTHHNTLDLDLYLRIAPELFLKRLLVGGFPKVYEINRNFRNEGISTQHNPEFTMLELYWAWEGFESLIALTEELFERLDKRLLPGDGLRWRGERLDLTRPLRRISIRGGIAELGGVPADRLERAEDVAAELAARNVPLPPAASYGQLLMTLFEHTVEHQLVQPTFVTDFPVEVSPLSKQRRDDPRFVERFELYVGGMELANAFSELNDPVVQAERFRQQVEAKAAGDQEAHSYDEDYVRALEFGMPPAAGEGIGIDRLTMLFADRQSIRDVILFPLLRPLPPGEEP